MTKTEDLHYFQGLCRGEPDILEPIFENFADNIQTYITSRGGSVDQARDIFLFAIKCIQKQYCPDGYQRFKSFGGLLFSICRQQFITQLRKKKRSAAIVDIEQLPEEGASVDEMAEAEAAIERQNAEKCKWEAFKKLTERCRQILNLRFAQGLSAKEVADELDTSANAIHQRVHDCSRRWRSLVRENCQ